MFQVTGREGNKFRLNNGRLYSVNQLLVIHDVQHHPGVHHDLKINAGHDYVRHPIKLKEEITHLTKTKKISDELKRSGIEQKNVIEGPRSRKPVHL